MLMSDSSPPSFAAKKRIVGSSTSTHTWGVVAELPDGSDSAFFSPAPCTANGSLPATTLAPPVSFQPSSEPSNVPPGAST